MDVSAATRKAQAWRQRLDSASHFCASWASLFSRHKLCLQVFCNPVGLSKTCSASCDTETALTEAADTELRGNLEVRQTGETPMVEMHGGRGRIAVMRVTVLGTGATDRPAWRRHCCARSRLPVWNRTAQRSDPLSDDGAAVARNTIAAVVDADVVVAMLFDAAATPRGAGDGAATGREGGRGVRPVRDRRCRRCLTNCVGPPGRGVS